MNDPPLDRHPWQFSLKSAWAAMTGVCVGCGLLLLIGPAMRRAGMSPMWVLLAAALIGFSTLLQWRDQESGWKRRAMTVVHVALCLYLPFGWLVVSDYPWNSYHLFWLWLLPVLPGFVPGAMLFHPHDAAEFTAMGVFTVMLLAGLSWLSLQGRQAMLVATCVALAVSVPSAAIAYAAFRA